MERMRLTHPKLSVSVRNGSEGPAHDPYAFCEIRASSPRGQVVLHEGLGSWIKCGGRLIETPHGFDPDEWPRAMFKILVGYSVEQLERFARRLTERCRSCGSRDFRWESGMPGEHLKICGGCGSVVDSAFRESEVM